jgi:hypothetical protein
MQVSRLGPSPMPRATQTKRASQIEKRGRRSAPKISSVEKSAVRIMRKLYEAIGGQPQRWESLNNLGAVKADAAGIAYAGEGDWLVISGGLHSVSLTEDGRRRVNRSAAKPGLRADPRRSALLRRPAGWPSLIARRFASHQTIWYGQAPSADPRDDLISRDGHGLGRDGLKRASESGFDSAWRSSSVRRRQSFRATGTSAPASAQSHGNARLSQLPRSQ